MKVQFQFAISVGMVAKTRKSLKGCTIVGWADGLILEIHTCFGSTNFGRQGDRTTVKVEPWDALLMKEEVITFIHKILEIIICPRRTFEDTQGSTCPILKYILNGPYMPKSH